MLSSGPPLALDHRRLPVGADAVEARHPAQREVEAVALLEGQRVRRARRVHVDRGEVGAADQPAALQPRVDRHPRRVPHRPRPQLPRQGPRGHLAVLLAVRRRGQQVGGELVARLPLHQACGRPQLAGERREAVPEPLHQRAVAGPHLLLVEARPQRRARRRQVVQRDEGRVAERPGARRRGGPVRVRLEPAPHAAVRGRRREAAAEVGRREVGARRPAPQVVVDREPVAQARRREEQLVPVPDHLLRAHRVEVGPLHPDHGHHAARARDDRVGPPVRHHPDERDVLPDVRLPPPQHQ